MNPQLKLFNTLTRQTEEIYPADGERFRFYCCGPTVYGPAHIGNLRTFILQDVFRRTLETLGVSTYHVRNLTDVDDKTIRESQALGESLKDFTERWTLRFHEDIAALNLLPPHVEPAATNHIAEQIKLIEILLAKGNAYQGEDKSVYFRTSSFPDYGKLAHLKLEDLQTQQTQSSGQANLADEYTRDSVADFALWKSRKADDGDNFWESPFGEGRPGWHLECSAMAMKYLGESFDLHSGGTDLIFPHHENEIAQSEAATGQPFARHWFHLAHLMVDGKKMSKSLGNLYTLKEILEMGYSAGTLRYLLLSAHYRQQLNFTEAGLKSSASALRKIDRAVSLLAEKARMQEGQRPRIEDCLPQGWLPDPEGWLASAWAALADDLNTPTALGALFSALFGLEKETKTMTQDTAAGYLAELAGFSKALGLIWFDQEVETEAPVDIRNIAEERWLAKQSRDFAKADELRTVLSAQGWAVVDTKDSYTLKPES